MSVEPSSVTSQSAEAASESSAPVTPAPPHHACITRGIAGIATRSFTPTVEGQSSLGTSGRSTQEVLRRHSETTDISVWHEHPAASGKYSSDGGGPPAVNEPTETAAQQDEQERQQALLYSSAPAGFRPSLLWQTPTSGDAVHLTSSRSLLNVKVPEEGPLSPRGTPDPDPSAKDDGPQLQVQSELHISSKTRFGHATLGGAAPSPLNIRAITPHNSIMSPRTTTVAAPEPMQTFLDYLAAEFRAADMLPVGDALWGQTERDRVYNFLLYVPYQLERLIQFGLLLCVDSFLGVMTLLPIRCFLAVRQAFLALRNPASRQPGKALGLGGGQVFDLLCLSILLCVTVCLRTVRPGWLYYWLKDITNEFLKMSVLSTAFEIADKILGNFGIKVMEALSGTCTLWVLGRLGFRHLLCDAFVALIIVLLHAMTLMCQGLVLAVALNSNRNGLLALLIASYFAEIKSVVFKRWDVERIRSLAWADVVERFHLVCVLLFVLVEDMANSATWKPSSSILRESVGILGAEAVIDIVKHAVLGKFNDVRPGIYREYMKDLCDKVVTSQSHNLHKLLEFHHLPCCALFLRSAVTLFWIKMDDVSYKQVCARVMFVIAMWLLISITKMAFGYLLKLITHQYVIYHNSAYQNKPFLRGASGKLVQAAKRPTEIRKELAGGAQSQGHGKEE